ncbi:hypothetical protein CSC94_12675 [Zhengella mangrovi]|uniref:Anti-CBASS protein Acb1-like N-terminal domain-containing protein n=1 Tax=Zhengella mangrovi TaxID=1982044 RepID=A0A2G1QMT8_9HYPH|nr:anti-CBASS Acb1 family protein [Zhengella mangrovi]PHP66538.1 hypothetical protein CSC94_12675 [Zhengella mangrovi]
MTSLARMMDGLRSFTSGLGTSRDKLSTVAYAQNLMSDAELLAAYETSWLVSKAIDIPAQDATREWRSWQASEDEVEKLEAEEKRLALRQKTKEALTLARIWGGAALLIGDGTDGAEPLNLNRVRLGGLKYVQALTRFDLSEGDIEDDIESEYFGRPRFYRLNLKGMQPEIHPSRLVIFRGAHRARIGALSRVHSWGDSIVNRIYEAATAADSTHKNIASLIFEAKVDVVRVPDLMRHLQTMDGEQRLRDRFSFAAMAKGINGTLILDKEEEYQSKSASFTNLPEVMQTMLQIVSGAADIPVTRFLGQTPSGLSSTGESDLRNYYDNVKDKQENEIGPAMTMLDECLVRSALGARPPEIHYTWASLWQMSEKDRAEIRERLANSISKLADTGIYPGEILEAMHTAASVDAGLYPGLEAALDEFAAEAEGLSEDDDGLLAGRPDAEIETETGQSDPARD